MFGEIAKQSPYIHLSEHRRRLADRYSAWAECLDYQTKPRKFFRAGGEPHGIGLIEINDLGNEKDLPRDTGFFDRRFHAFIDDALVRGMLVNDHKAIAGLGDDIGFVHL